MRLRELAPVGILGIGILNGIAACEANNEVVKAEAVEQVFTELGSSENAAQWNETATGSEHDRNQDIFQAIFWTSFAGVMHGAMKSDRSD